MRVVPGSQTNAGFIVPITSAARPAFYRLRYPE
jgi:hypothetical protein